MRVLQLVTRDDVGGVRVLSEVIGDGLRREGMAVETLALVGGSGVARIGHLVRVLKQVATGRHDAIFAYHPAASVVMGTLGRLMGVPRRLSHLTAVPEAMRPHWRLLDGLLGSTGGYTDIIANSTPTAQAFGTYSDAYRQRMRLIPHGVAPLPNGSDVDWRDRLKVDQHRRLLIASGRLAAQKDFATAVRALALLPEAELAIAGDGEQRAMLTSLARELGVANRLHLIGSLARADLGGLLRAGDCYLFPSVWETFGLAGVEAQMAGLPVVASDLPVLVEVLGRSPLVRFHPVGDAQALAEAVSKTLAELPDAAARTKQVHDTQALHGVDQMIVRYLSVLAPRPELC